MSGTANPPLTPPGQGGDVPGVGQDGMPPGFERIPFDRLRELNVPATDRKSIIKRTGSSESVGEPVQSLLAPPGQVAPPAPPVFIPGGGAPGARSTEGLSATQQDGGVASLAAPSTLAATATNPIVLENQKPGNPRSEWDLSGPASSNIEGFTTDISYNLGQRVDFKVNTGSANYRVDIYRLGYYGGAGARKVATLQNQARASSQPEPLREAATGMVDAGNWRVTDSWTMPSDTVSGVYVAKLVRQDGTFGESHVPFVVRNEASTSDIVFQTSDMTWQAYNGWGGANTYGGNGPGGGTAPGRAYAVSYNRPIVTRDGIGLYAGPQDYVFGAEYAALRWMEQNGYDVSYIAGVDASRNGALLRNHRIFTSTGHDEYWTGAQRNNVEAARDAGVNLAFMSGNEVYWKSRLAASPVDGRPDRSLVVYKETRQGPIDPTNEWTGTFRDLTYSGANDGGEWENGLTGTSFAVDSYRADAITIPYGQSLLRIWRDTSVAGTQPGQSATLTKNYLGYEWDDSPDNGQRPAGLVKLSSTTLPVSQYLMDFGNYVGDNNATHNLTLYKAPSGALVFGAGTVYWAWGLDPNHDLTATPADPRVQQAMVNLFADMGVQPQTLQASLRLASRSTDATAPVSSITGPAAGSSVGAGRQVTITGSSSDAGGVVAGVEVSTDNGQSWRPATGSAANWTYSWRTPGPGTYTIRSRAVDDSLNLESPGPGRSVTVTSSASLNMFQNDTPAILSTDDGAAVQLGMRFTPSEAGQVTGIRFYKGARNTGTHTGSLWTATGQRLASATFTNEGSSGWQQVNFAAPVSVAAGQSYIAAYHAPNGGYSQTPNYFVQPVTSGQLTAPPTRAGAPNGVYAYGSADAFPNQGIPAATNYWVDVVYSPGGTSEPPPPPPPPPSGTQTLFAATDTPATASVNDSQAVELGVKFSAARGGTIDGLRFYKGSGNTGTHTGSLWTASGQRLANATFTNETTSGWQQVTFATPVSISAGQTYVASYHAPNGNYAITGNYFAAARTSGDLTAPASGSSGGNGVYRYGASAFPNQSYNASNYWVDVLYRPGTTTEPPPPPPPPPSGTQTLFAATDTPATASVNDGQAVELGVKFSAARSGTVNGIRFYKGSGNTGTHTGSLWTASGQRLANATFTNETTSGWQQVTFATPVSISAGQTYVASYHAPNGNYAITGNYFAAARTSGDLTAPASGSSGGNGVYRYGASAFPNQSYNASNYWVDVLYAPGTTSEPPPPPPSGTTTLFASTDTPANPSINDPQAVQLGVKFSSSQAGSVTGIRFYKGSGNTGTHTGSLWTTSGQRLASVTFTNETATGWQQANFTTPVNITAGQTYIAAYHTTSGNYAVNGNYFAGARTSGPLTAPASSASGGNGVYAYGGATAFPNQSFNASNYWVDVVFQGQLAA